MQYKEQNNRLILRHNGAVLWIEPWGANSFRVRMTKDHKMDDNDWALNEPVPELPLQVTYETIDMTESFYHTEEACTVRYKDYFTERKYHCRD